MTVNSIAEDLTNETINFIYMQIKRKKNKQKIKYVINYITNLLLDEIKPYLLTTLAVLILMFIMNISQFYYYIKYSLTNHID